MNVYAFLFHFRKWVKVATSEPFNVPAKMQMGTGHPASAADLTALLNLAVVLDWERVISTLKVSGCATLIGMIYYYATGSGVIASLASEPVRPIRLPIHIISTVCMLLLAT